MAHEEPVNRALRYLAQRVITRFDLDQTLSELCEHATAVFDAVGSGVMLLDEDDQLTYVAASDTLVEQVNVVQTSMREGPCWTCSKSMEVVVARDLQADTRWPRFNAIALDAGLRSLACFPLAFDGRCLGTFNIFHDHPVRLLPEDVQAGELLAAAATVFLHNARAYTRAVELTDQLHHALRSRVVIEQAKGKLAAIHGLEPDEAFEFLRQRARARRQKLHELAKEVMAGESDLAP